MDRRLPTSSSRARAAAVSAFLAVSLILHGRSNAQPTPAETKPASNAAALERSNENAKVLLEVMARFSPEGAGRQGVPGLDEEILDLKPGRSERVSKAVEEARGKLTTQLASETDSFVKQDLEILIDAASQNAEGIRLQRKFLLPYFDPAQTVFQGIRALLDDQVPAERRAKALTRLKRYTGKEAGYTPITQLARDRISERLKETGLLGPVKTQVERDLDNGSRFVDGTGKLFEKYKLEGATEALETLKTQVAEYQAFIRKEVLPRARTDFRQPKELYAYSLKQVGVDMPVDELTSRARVAFREIQNEMQAIAPLVAKERGLSVTDYRDVLRELKKAQLEGDKILPHYQGRIKDLERLIAQNKVLTLPAREMRIRLASEAESSSQPAPNMRPPRLIGNTGEMGEFVLPLKIPGRDLQYDDFTHEAASWTLTAHEGRPGHELQFAAMVEKGVSTARTIFAFNSVNVEGWALYAEAEMKPYIPLDGQLVALQNRLLRAARAFLDPGLQLGTLTQEEATRVLRRDVVLSEAMAVQEVERYTYRAPGQATAYFCGYQRLMELRTDVERVLADRFDKAAFHDFVLSQGLLPPSLLRKAVMEEFVAGRKG